MSAEGTRDGKVTRQEEKQQMSKGGGAREGEGSCHNAAGEGEEGDMR